MSSTTANPSARRTELLEAAYQYVLRHGLAGLSLRPLAEAIGSSTRVLMFLFGNKDGLVRALLERARTEELALMAGLRRPERPVDLATAAQEVWTWLAADAHRPLLRLWAEAYARSLVDPDGPWAGFARSTVEDWLDVLAGCQPQAERDTEEIVARRTLTLAVLRGALLDLLATGDESRVTGAVHQQLALLRGAEGTGD
ncbi:TetR family transcriptional regulator [Streptomyces bikiniensis]|uniref:TetR family transcriptional regulator n=1 Tax=Streptomyces bikiniensis TaxID=1896 RepID=UPI0004BEB80E|nr:TetR family transcriptional regulator [Streptomyces bikiniensis]